MAAAASAVVLLSWLLWFCKVEGITETRRHNILVCSHRAPCMYVHTQARGAAAATTASPLFVPVDGEEEGVGELEGEELGVDGHVVPENLLHLSSSFGSSRGTCVCKSYEAPAASHACTSDRRPTCRTESSSSASATERRRAGGTRLEKKRWYSAYLGAASSLAKRAAFASVVFGVWGGWSVGVGIMIASALHLEVATIHGMVRTGGAEEADGAEVHHGLVVGGGGRQLLHQVHLPLQDRRLVYVCVG